MKCSSCGREFGSGVNCQYCGVDRVTGLGNYNGYDRPTGNHEYHNSRGSSRYSSNNGEFVSTKTTVCYACSEIIPADSMFCPYCKKELLVTCPKCGKIYSTQYSVCNKCGTDRHDYYLKLEAQKQEAKRRELAELEEYKKQKEKENEEKEVNTIVYFIMTPIWGAMWYAFLKNGITSLIQIPEVWPNTFPTDIIMCLLLGYLTQYILTYYFD